MTVTPSPQSVVVPVEPTEAMLDAFALQWHREDFPTETPDQATPAYIAGCKATMRSCWSAMLAAAPAPSSLAGGEVLDSAREMLALVLLKYGNLDADVNRAVERAQSAILAALSPEAPAREGVALDKRIADAAERDRRERDKAFRGESYEPLTPTHEALASEGDAS